MFDTVVVSITAILAVTFGWLLAERSAVRREIRIQARTSERIRLLIDLEINQNLHMLRGYYEQLGGSASFDPSKNSEEGYFHGRAITATRRALPSRGNEMWTGMSHELAAAFTSIELADRFSIHVRLRHLTELRGLMRSMWDTYMSTLNHAREFPKGQIPIDKEFGENGWQIMQEFDRIAEELLEKYPWLPIGSA